MIVIDQYNRSIKQLGRKHVKSCFENIIENNIRKHCTLNKYIDKLFFFFVYFYFFWKNMENIDSVNKIFTVDEAIDTLGFGKFQIMLSLLTGFAWVRISYLDKRYASDLTKFW